MATDTDCTIPCPKCARIFYRNDLLQRHLTLKHRRSPKRSSNLQESNLGGSLPAEPTVSTAPGESLPSNLGPELLSSTDHVIQNTHLAQGSSGMSHLSSLSPDPPDLLLIRSPVPFSPFALESHGHNYEWLYQSQPQPPSASANDELGTNQRALGQDSVSRHALLYFVLINRCRRHMVAFLSPQYFKSSI